jgi:hypothetical protein
VTKRAKRRERVCGKEREVDAQMIDGAREEYLGEY